MNKIKKIFKKKTNIFTLLLIILAAGFGGYKYVVKGGNIDLVCTQDIKTITKQFEMHHYRVENTCGNIVWSNEWKQDPEDRCKKYRTGEGFKTVTVYKKKIKLDDKVSVKHDKWYARHHDGKECYGTRYSKGREGLSDSTMREWNSQKDWGFKTHLDDKIVNGGVQQVREIEDRGLLNSSNVQVITTNEVCKVKQRLNNGECGVCEEEWKPKVDTKCNGVEFTQTRCDGTKLSEDRVTYGIKDCPAGHCEKNKNSSECSDISEDFCKTHLDDDRCKNKDMVEYCKSHMDEKQCSDFVLTYCLEKEHYNEDICNTKSTDNIIDFCEKNENQDKKQCLTSNGEKISDCIKKPNVLGCELIKECLHNKNLDKCKIKLSYSDCLKEENWDNPDCNNGGPTINTCLKDPAIEGCQTPMIDRISFCQKKENKGKKECMLSDSFTKPNFSDFGDELFEQRKIELQTAWSLDERQWFGFDKIIILKNKNIPIYIKNIPIGSCVKKSEEEIKDGFSSMFGFKLKKNHNDTYVPDDLFMFDLEKQEVKDGKMIIVPLKIRPEGKPTKGLYNLRMDTTFCLNAGDKAGKKEDNLKIKILDLDVNED